MTLRKLNRKEGIRLMQEAKKGDKQKIEMIVESFKCLIKSNYNRYIHEKYNINLEDFQQDCNVKIIQCINDFRKESLWQFFSFIETSLKYYTFDVIEKHRNYNDFNVICEDTIENFRTNKIDEGSYFENHVVSEITAYESFDTLIRDKLSKREKHVLHSHISGKSLKEYAAASGIKVDTARRTLNKAISKIVNKEEIKAFHCLTITFFIFLKMIVDEIGVFDILEVFG